MKSNKTYFQQLNQALKNYKRAIPCLLIDLDWLDKNIATLKANLKNDTDFRIVVKSLPSIDLVQYVMKKAGTNQLMVFHQPFLTDFSQRCDEAVDILLGKPMPIKTAAYFYESFQNSSAQFNPFHQWLVDTPKRTKEYIALVNTNFRGIPTCLLYCDPCFKKNGRNNAACNGWLKRFLEFN